MEKLVAEVKKIVKFKDTTDIGDIVLVVAKNPRMLIYALVTDITRDETKRDEWWHVTFQFLAIPPRKTNWILRTPQMTGMEIFTMNGEQRFVKAVDFHGVKPLEQGNSPGKKGKKPVLKRVK